MEWAVEVEDMTVAYTTKPVLWDVDMKVPIGSLAASVGPNGAGQSSTHGPLRSPWVVQATK